MCAASQRSNGVFVESQSAPKRIHSLMDICAILARKKPRANDALEVTEWHQLRGARLAERNSVLDAVQAAKRKPADGPGFVCPVPGCDKKYGRRFRVVEHMQLRHEAQGRPLFRCGEVTCLKSYDKHEDLKKHQHASGHRGSEVSFEAAEDRTSSSTAPEVRLVEGEAGLRYKCSHLGCEKSYSTKYRCSVHLLNCHGQANSEKPFACPAAGCSKAYATKDSLNRHKRVCPLQESPSRPPEPKRLQKDSSRPSCEYEATPEFKDRVQELVRLIEEIA